MISWLFANIQDNVLYSGGGDCKVYAWDLESGAKKVSWMLRKSWLNIRKTIMFYDYKFFPHRYTVPDKKLLCPVRNIGIKQIKKTNN